VSILVGVGTELAHARKARGLSLSDLAQRTKIGVAALDAIERGDVTQLPGGIFTRGFVRAYAREVGCDPEATVARFLVEYGDRPRFPVVSPQNREADQSAACHSGQVHVAEIDFRDRQQSRAAWARIGVVVTVLALAYVGFRPNSWHGDVTDPSAGTAGRPPGVADTAPEREVGTAGVQQGHADLPPAVRADALRLDVEPDGPCWLAATADGRQVVYRLLAAGERTRIDARDAVVLRVGDAGRFRFAINGQAARRLGDAGQPLTVTITRQNYKEFLATR
jgi:transcriptional regulator with XRE-family HTH domain